MENLPIKIGMNEEGFNSWKAAFEAVALKIKQSVIAFNALGLGDLLANELQQLFTDTETFVFDRMVVNKSIVIDGLELNKVEAMKIIKKPAGYDDLIAKINEAKEAIVKRGIKINSINTFYYLDASNNVVILEQKLNYWEGQYAIYATTERQYRRYTLAVEICNKIRELGEVERIIMREPEQVNLFQYILQVQKGTTLDIVPNLKYIIGNQ